MNTVIDPFTGEEWHAEHRVDPEPAPWRPILAGSLVLLSCIFLFVVLPLL